MNHRQFVKEDLDPMFSNIMFNLQDQKWRNMRATLSPAFTGSKMRNMFVLISECTQQMGEFMKKKINEKGPQSLELKEFYTRAATDIIASTAFGLKVDSLKDEQNIFYRMGQKLTGENFKAIIKIFAYLLIPRVMKFFNISFIDYECGNFFRKLVGDTMALREKENIHRPDMIQLLMQAKKGSLVSTNEDKDDTDNAGFATAAESTTKIETIKTVWTHDELTAQALMFFLAGFDTTSTVLCFLTHELATHPEIQERLQREIDDVCNSISGTPNYETVVRMKYLDMVVSEGLRLWPPFVATERVCTKSYNLEDHEGNNLKDEKHFENPNHFDPERFSEENKHKIQPFTYMPFGVGPRNCIASRFALMSVKMIIFELLRNFDIVPCEKTQIPLKLTKGTFNMKVEKGFWMEFITWILVAVLVYAFYKYSTWTYDRFEGTKVPYKKPFPFFGNTGPFMLRMENMIDNVGKVYRSFPNKRFYGVFQLRMPAVMIKDPELIRQIGVKDFDNFPNHRPFITDDVDPMFGNVMLNLQDQKWRDMRATLSPAFTGSKMRNMFRLLSECTEQMADFMKKEIDTKGPQSLELKNLYTRATTDVIASTAFGLKVNSLKEKDNLFYRMGQRFNFGGALTVMKLFAHIMFPKVMKFFKIALADDESSNFFRSLVGDTIALREKENIHRPDMIQLLMQAKKGALRHEVPKNEDHNDDNVDAGFATVAESHVTKSHTTKRVWTDDELTAQAMIFFLAGFDTTSTVLCFLTHELALHPEIQQRLQQEIDDICDSIEDKPSYETVVHMKYLDMVVSESLRLWPPLAVTDRVCIKPYEIEDYEGNKFEVRKGEVVLYPIYYLQRDEKYYENPDKFDPERFSDDNKHKIKPFTYMPFGVGPRNCIASRFALMEVKMIIFELLRHFDIVPCEKTQIPLKIKKSTFNMHVEKGFWVTFKKRVNK
ncbi:cytochrome P450 9e2-like [Ctenocephalides felis]|uniref:cytochrome P450 9e2-like n=1 Tax=Ctenocephalides felis TaxID=7515 RepID=UPI000E6E518A|nr:cytochrome P450 9e2-like [Ctenocephalides felis]